MSPYINNNTVIGQLLSDKHCFHLYSLNNLVFITSYEINTNYSLYMKKRRHIRINKLAHHITDKWQSQNLSSGNPAPKPVLLTTLIKYSWLCKNHPLKSSFVASGKRKRPLLDLPGFSNDISAALSKEASSLTLPIFSPSPGNEHLLFVSPALISYSLLPRLLFIQLAFLFGTCSVLSKWVWAYHSGFRWSRPGQSITPLSRFHWSIGSRMAKWPNT